MTNARWLSDRREEARRQDALEFRPDHKGRFDEIVARFADGMVHVETMSDKSCYVGFYWDDGRYCQWWINSDKKLQYHHEDGFSQRAQGIEAGTGETERLDPQDESPVGKADAPEHGDGGACPAPRYGK